MKQKKDRSKRFIIFFSFFLFSFFFINSSLSALTLDETLASLSSVSNTDSAEFRWDPLLKDGVFNLGDHFGTFSTASREGETGYILYNNRELFNVPLPYNRNGSLFFPEVFVNTLRTAFTRSFENDASRFRVSTIIIDPGHGGRDPGAVSTHTINGRQVQVMEKDIVLRAGLALRDLLRQAYPDKRILMTRETDIYLSLDQRSDMANSVNVRNNEAVIFISIHANWGASPNARGYEVWHISTNHRRTLLNPQEHNYTPDILAILNAMLEEEFTQESIILANSILDGFRGQFGNTLPSRGRKENNWFVVRNSHMPAVLVELGFVSNQQDAILMTSDEGLQKFAHALYNGVSNFIGIVER